MKLNKILNSILCLAICLIIGSILVDDKINSNEIKNESVVYNTVYQAKAKKKNTKKVVKKKTTKKTTKKVVKKTIKKKTTKKVTKKKTTTKKVTLKNKQNMSEIVSEEVKHGVRFLTLKNYVLNTYSNGTTKITNEYTYNTIDPSGYSATTSELFGEASERVNNEINDLNEMLNYVNGYRAEVGHAPLVLDLELSKAAMVRAMELAYSGIFSHTRPNNTSCFSVFDELGIYHMGAGENIAAGMRNVEGTANQWRHSEGHYNNMINEGFGKLGVGKVCLDGTIYGCYWVQLFTD